MGCEDAPMTSPATIDLNSNDPADREIQQCPFGHYATLRADGGVFYDNKSEMYFASRHDVVNRILRDTETFSSEGSNAKSTGSPEVMAQVAEIMAQGWPTAGTMLTIDPPHQTRYRKLVSRIFSARRIAGLEDTIREIAVDLIEQFPDEGPVDFHDDFASRLPVAVIHRTLNMAPHTFDKIKYWTWASSLTLGAAPSDEDRLEGARRRIEAQQYWHEEYLDRLENPGDDILSSLVHADFADPDLPEDETRKLDFPEVYGIVRQLMVAGNDSTTKFLDETMRLLIENPRWWAEMENDPAGTINGLVEEGLRVGSPNQGLFRTVTRDVELDGVTVPAGSTVWVMFASANRDEDVFADPEVFDASRDNLKEHVAFGKGHHFCIGAPLSRLEGKVAFEELVKSLKLPTFREDNTFEYEPSFILRGLDHLNLNVEKR